MRLTFYCAFYIILSNDCHVVSSWVWLEKQRFPYSWIMYYIINYIPQVLYILTLFNSIKTGNAFDKDVNSNEIIQKQ